MEKFRVKLFWFLFSVGKINAIFKSLDEAKELFHNAESGWKFPDAEYADLNDYLNALDPLVRLRADQLKDLMVAYKTVGTVLNKDQAKMRKFLREDGNAKTIK